MWDDLTRKEKIIFAKGPVFAETGYDEKGYWLRTNAKIKRVKCYAGCTICSFYISMCDWEIWLEWDK